MISADKIAAKQERTLPDALLDVPGLSVVQTGGPGGLTSLFIRGTNSNQTKVFLDGIDVSDPSSPNGALDFAHVLTFDLGRIKVLRRPQSGLYGSDAIGGVINIVTEKGEGPTMATANLENGSLGTVGLTSRYIETTLYSTSDDFLGPESLPSYNGSTHQRLRPYDALRRAFRSDPWFRQHNLQPHLCRPQLFSEHD